MGPFPHDAPAATDQRRQSDGHRWFEFVEYAHPQAGRAARAVQADGLCAGRAPQDQEDHGLSPGRHQLSRQRSARHPRLRFRRRARAVRAVDGVPRGRCDSRPIDARCRSARSPPILLPRRRRSTFPPSRASAAACCISSTATAPRARPTTPSSNGWAHRTRSPQGAGLFYLDHLTHNVHRGRMDVWTGFYEKLFNFRQIRFFDIEGPRVGPVLARADQPRRQDPDPDQRGCRRSRPDRGISHASIAARASSTSPAAPARHLPHRRDAARRRLAVHAVRRPKPISRRSTRACRSMARTSRGCSATAF